METAIVIGAGMVGLSTAWHLQEHGVEVTVVDREGVAAGSSWGNAGYLSPALTLQGAVAHCDMPCVRTSCSSFDLHLSRCTFPSRCSSGFYTNFPDARATTRTRNTF